MAFDIKKLSPREKNLVGMLVVVFSTVPFFQFTMPVWNQYIASINKIQDNKTRLNQLENEITKLEKLKKENIDLSKKLDNQKSYLAKSYEIDFLVQDLKKICDENSISLDSFTPTSQEPVNIVLEKQAESNAQGRPVSKQKLKQALEKLKGQDLPVDLYRFPIEVKIAGGFTDTVELFKKLEKYGRVVSVDNISIGKVQAKKSFGDRLSRTKPKEDSGDDTDSLLSTFDLIAYSLPPSEDATLSLEQLKKSGKETGTKFQIKRKR
ncbi:MAG: hypothetical protein HYY52_00645 [Candidatus Melainabacteria bacterium]|nr:hypothetical protein [Candidatus Melainabacteria bacterium]